MANVFKKKKRNVSFIMESKVPWANDGLLQAQWWCAASAQDYL